MLTKEKTFPIAPTALISNGSLNNSFVNFEHVQAYCKGDRKMLLDAIWNCVCSLTYSIKNSKIVVSNLPDWGTIREAEDLSMYGYIIDEYLRCREKDDHYYVKPIHDVDGKKFKSTVEILASIGHGKWEVECTLDELIRAMHIRGAANDFNPSTAAAALRKYFDFKQYYNENNPNNGRAFFTFTYDSNGAIYVQMNPRFNKFQMLSKQQGRHYSKEDFVIDCRCAKNMMKADESYLIFDTETNATWRFWWD